MVEWDSLFTYKETLEKENDELRLHVGKLKIEINTTR